MNAAKAQAAKVPGVKSVLESNQRSYDPENDVEVKECSICLTDFSPDDPRPLVELKCSNKHVFHLECMEAWVEN